MDDENKINATFIVEILGKPKEHVKESLDNLIGKINDEKGVMIVEKTVHEPRELEIKEEKSEKPQIKDKLFTSFAEIEANFENINSLLFVVFNYMPSNVEINNPETFVFKNSYLGELLTGIILRLHKYDEVTKKVVQDNAILENKLRMLGEYVKEKGLEIKEEKKEGGESKEREEERGGEKKEESTSA